MTKTYTVQKIRSVIAGLENNLKYGMERIVIASPDVIAILRQAADALERENNRKKEYEYAISYHDTTNGKRFIGVHYTSISDAEACSIKHEDVKKTYVRREVSKWEEVKDA